MSRLLPALLALLALHTSTNAHATGPEPTPASEPTAASEPTPTPEPTPASTPEPAPASESPSRPAPASRPTPTTTTYQPQSIPTRPVHDRLHRFELSATSEVLFFASSTPDATTDNDIAFTPSLRVGLGLTEHLVLSVGWRPVADMSRADLGYDLTTSGDAAIVTARYELPLTGALALAAELDLELSHLDFDLAVGSLSGSTSTWGFGAIPRAVFITRADLDAIALDFRAFVGFAVRTAHRPDDLRLGSGSADVAPLDLGALDLTGLTLGATFALSF